VFPDDRLGAADLSGIAHGHENLVGFPQGA
jgi:hypothetical protein